MTTGPEFSTAPNLNHVALSLPADALDADGRAALCSFYGDVFGFEEYDILTEDRKQLVFRVHSHEQFVFLIADEAPMTAPRFDHFGLSVSTKDDFEAILHRAQAWQAKEPDAVDIVGPEVEHYYGVLDLHNFYVRYRLPLMVETQWFEWS